MSTDAHPTPSAHAEATTIRGRLGPSAIMFMVIAAAAPLTVVGGLVPIGILASNGLGFPVMFLAASAILLLFSVGLMALVRHIPETGTFSSYIGAGLGFRAGAAAAGLALTCYSAVQAAVFSYLGLLTDLTERYLGPIGSIVVTLLFIGSMFAAVLSLHNVVARYQYSLARTWMAPAFLSQVHTRHGSPSISALVQVGTASALVLAISALSIAAEEMFSWGAGIGSIAIALLMAVTCMSVIRYFHRQRGDTTLWQRLVAPLLGAAGLLLGSILIIMNFPLLVGDSSADGSPAWGTVSLTLLAIVIASPIAGWLLSFTSSVTRERIPLP